MTDSGQASRRPDRVAAQRDRDDAFARIGRVRGWTIAGAGALAAGIAAFVSAVAPGRTLGAKAPISSSAAATTAALTMPPLASPSELGLQGPDSAPQAAPTPQVQQPAPQPQASQSSSGPVVSGGS